MSREEPQSYGSYVDGAFEEVSAGIGSFSVRTTDGGDPVATVAEGGEPGVRRACEAANRAFEIWREWSGEERAAVLHDVADAVRAHSEQLATARTRESGRLYAECETNVEITAEIFSYYAGLADKLEGESIPVPGDRLAFTVREPYGVTGHIVPWNAPLLLGARSFAPALACGNTVVGKPSPEAPLGLLELARVATEAGLPPGTLNMVPGHGSETGAALTSEPIVQHVTFTGSRDTGSTVMRAAADRIVPVELELGGKSPSIVFPDADLEYAAEQATLVFRNAGQKCFACTRLYVHADIYDEFLEDVVGHTESLALGSGREEADVGPLISGAAQERVANYVDRAIENGARLRTGGTVPRTDGHFYAPTILDRVDDDAPISCEEVFGPVLVAYEFESESEVVRRANETEFGLYSAVWTGDVSRARRIAEQLEAGGVSINEYPVPFPQLPFAGHKSSGIGTQFGAEAMDHYSHPKTITLAGRQSG